jgi:predicted permease
MLINFIKVAWRNIVRGRGFTLINITGLTVGMASAMLILLWVQDELSYDRWYANTDRLYQCWDRGRDNQGVTCLNITPQVLGPALKQEYPEVEQATRVGWDETLLFSVGDKKVNIRGTMTDPYFLTMFGFPFVAGDRNTALNNPNSVVLTQKAATVLFGSSDVVGKVVRLDNKYDMTVTAVMKDLPGNTQFDFEFILPWTYLRWTNQTDSSWGHVSTHNYVLLKPHTDLVSLNKRLDDIYARHSADTARHAFLYPLSQLHLYPKFENGVPVGSKMESVRVFILIAVLILLIACINFMNMSTARSEKRAREVGIRKVSGALRGSLIAQFLGESILLAAMAGALALVVVELCLPAFNEITGKQMSIAFGNAYLWVFYAGFIVITGVVAGSYPAFFLSAFRPVSVLKGQFKKAHALITPRKALVVVQFSFAVVLIICTIIIQQQLRYVQDRETGFDRHNLIYTLLSGDMNQHYDMIKGDLLNKGIAEAVTKSSGPLSNTWSFGGADWPGKDPNDKTGFNYFNCDGDIVRAAGLHLIAGRDIDVRHYPTDSSAVILNEAAVRVMGFKNPIGQIINRGTWGVDWHVIGVVKDFILESPYDQIKPICIQGPKANWFNMIHIKFNGAHTTAESLAATEKVFRQYNPQYPFEYQFIDQEYAKKFSDEQKTETLTAFFAGLTIFISCLGLFGLAAYMAENRIKEIGVRKVLGASVVSITTLLSRDFLKLVVIAIVVASPIAWWSMNKWLAGYSYRVPIYWWIFAAAGASAVAIALLTVSFQAVRAAMANPVKSLRSE